MDQERWKTDAEDYGRMVRKGGWALAYLAARNVGGTCTLAEFAAEAKTGEQRVRRHLEAWDKASMAGVVAPRKAFVGTTFAVQMPDNDVNPFTNWYDSTASVATGIKGDRRDAIIAAALADGVGAGKTLDVAQNRKAVLAAIKSDPVLAKAIADDAAAGLAVMRELNKRAEDAVSARGPKPKGEDEGPGLTSLRELMIVAEDLKKIVAAFSSQEVPEGQAVAFTEDAQVVVVGYADEIIGRARVLKQLVRGEVRTHLTEDDFNALLSA